MLYGTLMGEAITITDSSSGKPIVESSLDYVPDGYVAKSTWKDVGDRIVQIWDIKPQEGTAEEAALALSRLQFMSLPDEAAYTFRALANRWEENQAYYGPSDASGTLQSRVLWNGELYKCLQSHTSQVTWEPDAAPSLWAKILPGQEGNTPEDGYAEWVQPGAMNGYSQGDKVVCDGHLWESTQNDNVWKPGDVGAPWTDLGVYPPEE